jgi:hypothetical protein
MSAAISDFFDPSAEHDRRSGRGIRVRNERIEHKYSENVILQER